MENMIVIGTLAALALASEWWLRRHRSARLTVSRAGSDRRASDRPPRTKAT
jgi:hypothetical protein